MPYDSYRRESAGPIILGAILMAPGVIVNCIFLRRLLLVRSTVIADWMPPIGIGSVVTLLGFASICIGIRNAIANRDLPMMSRMSNARRARQPRRRESGSDRKLD